MRLACEACGKLHIDEGEFLTKPHHTHSCQFCGLTWRPAVVHTIGVQFLPGFKNEQDPMTHLNPCLFQVLWAFNSGFWVATLVPWTRGWRDKLGCAIAVSCLAPAFTLIWILGEIISWHEKRSPS